MSWIGSAITAGAGLISGLFQPSYKKQARIQDEYAQKAQQRQFDYQTQLNQQAQDFNLQNMEIQNKYAVDNWLMQQEYNSPTEQLKRVKDAGLNPNLVMGQSGVTNATNSSPDVPSSQNPSTGSAGSFGIGSLSPTNPVTNAFEQAIKGLQTSLQYESITQDIRNKQANENLTNAQAKNTLQNTLKQQQETMTYLLDNEKKSFENSTMRELYKFRIEQIKQDIKETQSAIRNLDAQSNLSDSNADLNLSRKKEISANIKKLENDSKFIQVKTRLEEWALSFQQMHNRLPSSNALFEEAASIFNAVFGTNRNRVNDNDERGLIGVIADSVIKSLSKQEKSKINKSRNPNLF